MADVRNILVGAAQIFVSRGTGAYRPVTKPGVSQTTGQAYPGLANAYGDVNWTSATSAKTYLAGQTTKWRDVGYTNTGLEVSYEPGYNDVMVDQLLDSARLFKSTLKVVLRTTLAEGTLENLQLVFGQNENYVTFNASTLAATVNYPLSYAGGDSLDPAKVSLSASIGTSSAQFTGVTVSPVTAASVTGGPTFTLYPTFNIVRDNTGTVVGVVQVFGGTGIGTNTVSGSLKLAGTSQVYAGGTGNAGQDVYVTVTASAQGAGAATLNIEAGALGDAPVERTIVAVGNAPTQFGAGGTAVADQPNTTATVPQGASNVTTTNKERVYVARRVVQVITSAHGLKRDAATEFPVEFRCLPDDSDIYDGAEYGVIIDRVFTAN